VITGAKNIEQLQSNVKAADWQLTTRDLSELDAIL
jgi:aryl-alcohol dehydrogenase-like predicted oxidoreductase